MISTLQDAGAVVVYNITDPMNPVYDSGAISELNDYTQQDGGVMESPKVFIIKMD